jgi:hypothetical protein
MAEKKSDYRKLSPRELETRGLPRKSERYINIQTGEIVSKRQYVKRTTGETLEQRQKNIAKNLRRLAENAPKKARAMRIKKAAERRESKPVSRRAPKPTEVKWIERRSNFAFRYRMDSADPADIYSIIKSLQKTYPGDIASYIYIEAIKPDEGLRGLYSRQWELDEWDIDLINDEITDIMAGSGSDGLGEESMIIFMEFVIYPPQ